VGKHRFQRRFFNRSQPDIKIRAVKPQEDSCF